MISLKKKSKNISTADFIEKKSKKIFTADFIEKKSKKIFTADFIEKNSKKISTADFIEKQNCDILPHISGGEKKKCQILSKFVSSNFSHPTKSFA